MIVQAACFAEREANPQNQPQSRLRAVTRPHEAEIPSRLTADSDLAKQSFWGIVAGHHRLTAFFVLSGLSVESSGEYVPAPCTHCPSSQPSGKLTAKTSKNCLMVLAAGLQFWRALTILVRSSHGSARWAKS